MENQPDTIVLKKNIVERSNSLSSMPDMKYLLTAREIRDLVSFLSTLTEDEMYEEPGKEEAKAHGE